MVQDKKKLTRLDRVSIDRTEYVLMTLMALSQRYAGETYEYYMRRITTLEALMGKFRNKVKGSDEPDTVRMVCHSVNHIIKLFKEIYTKLRPGTIWTPLPQDQAENIGKLGILVDKVDRFQF